MSRRVSRKAGSQTIEQGMKTMMTRHMNSWNLDVVAALRLRAASGGKTALAAFALFALSLIHI